ncbi:MAG: hypothetical protein JNL42_09155 [Anaerolineae bacterium]|nr:hypothetical protein [Anaerolineae bacterium]
MMVTVDLKLRLQLSEDVVQKARESGLLTDEKIGELITAEVERRRSEAAARLRDTMDQLSALMREEYGDLSEEEAQALLSQWLSETDDAPELGTNRPTSS